MALHPYGAYTGDYVETYTEYEEVHTSPPVQYVEHIQVVQPQVVQPVVHPVIQPVVQPVVQAPAQPVHYAPAREPYVALSQIPYTGIDMGTAGTVLNIALLLGLSMIVAYTLTIYLPRYGSSVRRLVRHFWRNELAREIDVDEEVLMFFEQEMPPPQSRTTQKQRRRSDIMAIQPERGDEPPRIIIART